MTLLALAAMGALFGCEPKLVVGTRTCSGDAAVRETADPVTVPWSSSFENQFCDYGHPAGFCYTDPGASYRTVTSPVRSGAYTAAFTVNSADPGAQQTRCVQQGTLPKAAYYGAWYFIPTPATVANGALWNLFHFQTTDRRPEPGLWDVSLENGPDGALQLFVYDFLNHTARRPATPVPVPIGAWFHIQFYLVRAPDPTGEVALYQDGELLFDLKNILTDDSSVGQWYVGNLARGDLMPSESTLYVDDVSISATL